MVQEVLGAAGMGHNNPRQKIQYHLRLKQELEELRHECMLLLRERFHLEQCVRSAPATFNKIYPHTTTLCVYGMHTLLILVNLVHSAH